MARTLVVTLCVMMLVAQLAHWAEASSTTDAHKASAGGSAVRSLSRKEQVRANVNCYLSVLKSARPICNQLFWTRQSLLQARNVAWSHWHALREQPTPQSPADQLTHVKTARKLYRLYKGTAALYWRLYADSQTMGCNSCWRGANAPENAAAARVHNDDTFDPNQNKEVKQIVPDTYTDAKVLHDSNALKAEEEHAARTTASDARNPPDLEAEQVMQDVQVDAQQDAHKTLNAHNKKEHESWYHPGCSCCQASAKAIMRQAPDTCKRYRSHKQLLYHLLARTANVATKSPAYKGLAAELATLLSSAKLQMKQWKGLLQCPCWL